MIQLEGQAVAVTITAIDYAAGTLTVDTPLTWSAGTGVSLPYLAPAPIRARTSSRQSAFDFRLWTALRLDLGDELAGLDRVADLDGEADERAVDGGGMGTFIFIASMVAIATPRATFSPSLAPSATTLPGMGAVTAKARRSSGPR